MSPRSLPPVLKVTDGTQRAGRQHQPGPSEGFSIYMARTTATSQQPLH